MGSRKIIGIDLGTSNSMVAVWEGSGPKVLANRHGHRITPSVVAFDDKGRPLIGTLATQQTISNPRQSIYSAKRFLGRRQGEVSSAEQQTPFELVGEANDLVKIRIGQRDYTPQEIGALLLQDLKETAESYLGEAVEDVVITVPSYFNDSQRTATKEACKIAGLRVKRIINESTAAAMAYALGHRSDQQIAVLHFGGGTFDISIVEMADLVVEVMATNGDCHLGGDDFDKILVDHFAAKLEKSVGRDVREDSTTFHRLREAAEKAKCELSTASEAEINLPYIATTAEGPEHLTMKVTREEFEQLAADIFDRLRPPCKLALEDAVRRIGGSSLNIRAVIPVGGSTRIPKVQQIAKEMLECELDKSINPDEAVALGAAVQGAIMAGEVMPEPMVLLDVTALSLGVETLGGVMSRLIERNTTIPTSKKETFSTAEDNQTSVSIHVLQGEREFAKDNRTLGTFELKHILPAGKGVPQIEVSFDIDADGVLRVSARDSIIDKAQSIEIRDTESLSAKEIEGMRRQLEQFAEEGQAHDTLVSLINKAEQIAYKIESAVKKRGEGIEDEECRCISVAISKVREAVSRKDREDIERSIKELDRLYAEA